MHTCCPQSTELHLRSRIYPANGVRARPILVHTRERKSDAGKIRYPFAENYLGGTFQQHVHICRVVVLDGAEEKIFAVFFKRHRSFGTNSCIVGLVHPSTLTSATVHSDVVVMRVGTGGQFINMRGKDGHIADLMMGRYVAWYIYQRSKIDAIQICQRPSS